jgi:hypothetical protein
VVLVHAGTTEASTPTSPGPAYDPPPEIIPDPTPTGRSASASLAWWAFVAYLGVALIVLLVVGHERWFLVDDWDILAGRSLTHLGDLFRPHNEHLSTLPIVEYLVYYRAFGFNHTPFEVTVIVAHLATAALLRTVMRRSGVGPWVATFAASTFVLFGAGVDDILSAWQISFVAPVALALGQLVLIDHDDHNPVRDVGGAAAAIAGVLCSSVAPPVLVGVAVAAWLRRGWRVAAAQVGPALVLFAVWYHQVDPHAGGPGAPSVLVELRWIRAESVAVFEGLEHLFPVAIALGILVPVGLALAWRPLSSTSFRRAAAAPIGLLVAGVVFAAVNGYGRWVFGVPAAEVSRYVYVGAALWLPAIAVAADAFIGRWPITIPVAVVFFVLSVPWNLAELRDDPFATVYSTQQYMVERSPRLPVANVVPGSVRIDPPVFGTNKLTLGQVRRELDRGRLPDPGPVRPDVDATITLRLSLAPVERPVVAAACQKRTAAFDVHLPKGSTFVIETNVTITQLGPGGQPLSSPVPYSTNDGRVLASQVPDLFVRIQPPGAVAFTVCDLPP